MRTEKRIGSYTLRKMRKEERIMNADKILAAAKMYNKVVEKMLECESVNTANNYETDNLFVQCKGGSHYTNEMGDIMPNDFDGEFYSCKGIEETAAKYTELCLAAGCTADDIYTSY